jgi:hypothetical protein
VRRAIDQHGKTFWENISLTAELAAAKVHVLEPPNAAKLAVAADLSSGQSGIADNLSS